MKKIFNFFATILLLIPILAKADNYPINKNIDIDMRPMDINNI